MICHHAVNSVIQDACNSIVQKIKIYRRNPTEQASNDMIGCRVALRHALLDLAAVRQSFAHDECLPAFIQILRGVDKELNIGRTDSDGPNYGISPAPTGGSHNMHHGCSC